MSTLSGNRYFEISTEETSLNDFVLNPIDNNGNLFNNVTIIVDTTLGDFTLNLPSIAPSSRTSTPTLDSSLGFNLNIVKSTGDEFKVIINSNVNDTIGSIQQIALNRKGSAILSPVSTNMWDAQITQ
jgi:hypothetical protein